MRKPRLETISTTGTFHKMWRGHNRERVFADDVDKRAYLNDLARCLTEDLRRLLVWHAYCLMDNHTHENGQLEPDAQGDLTEAIRALGDWMRNAHSRFGQQYNRRHDRQGKVAYDRPKTTEVKDTIADRQRAIFYADVNPVRAGMVKHPSQYRFSSYRFYAFGEADELTRHLTPPDWYVELGQTPEVRQMWYRRLCDAYMRELGLIDDAPLVEVSGAPGTGVTAGAYPETPSAAWGEIRAGPGN